MSNIEEEIIRLEQELSRLEKKSKKSAPVTNKRISKKQVKALIKMLMSIAIPLVVFIHVSCIDKEAFRILLQMITILMGLLFLPLFIVKEARGLEGDDPNYEPASWKYLTVNFLCVLLVYISSIGYYQIKKETLKSIQAESSKKPSFADTMAEYIEDTKVNTSAKNLMTVGEWAAKYPAIKELVKELSEDNILSNADFRVIKSRHAIESSLDMPSPVITP